VQSGGTNAREVAGQISQAWKDHIQAARDKDFDAVMDIYADNVTYIIPGVQEARGKDELGALEAAALATADVLHAEHTIDSLRVFGEVAYEIGTVIGPVQPKGQEAIEVTFHFTAMWRKQADGSWRIESMVGEPE